MPDLEAGLVRSVPYGQPMDPGASIDRHTLATLLERERAEFVARNPRSHTAYKGAEHLFGRVPMTWMNKAAAGFPVYLAHARGARVTDIDGHEYVDFCLGDTGAMAGHSPAPTVAAVQRRFGELGGASAMLPTEDARVGRRRAQPPVRDGGVELLADRHRRQPLGDPAGAGRHRPTQDPRQQLLLPRQRRRVADRRRSGRSRREPGGQRRRAGGRSRRPAGSPSTTTSTASSASWRTATSPPC